MSIFEFSLITLNSHRKPFSVYIVTEVFIHKADNPLQSGYLVYRLMQYLLLDFCNTTMLLLIFLETKMTRILIRLWLELLSKTSRSPWGVFAPTRVRYNLHANEGGTRLISYRKRRLPSVMWCSPPPPQKTKSTCVLVDCKSVRTKIKWFVRYWSDSNKRTLLVGNVILQHINPKGTNFEKNYFRKGRVMSSWFPREI